VTTEEGLLAAILANPECDLPRLALADHYEGELGQPERAEFIRLQIELAKGNDPMDLTTPGEQPLFPYRWRQRELWDAHGPSWFSERPDGCCVGIEDADGTVSIGGIAGPIKGNPMIVRRGFVHTVRCSLADWVGGEACGRCNPAEFCDTCQCTGSTPGIGPQIVARHPVERLAATDRVPEAERYQPGSEPWRYNWFFRAEYGWQVATDAQWVDEPDHLPGCLFEHMPGTPLADMGDFRFSFDSREDAMNALSSALIAWAKSQNKPKTPADHVRAIRDRAAAGDPSLFSYFTP